MPIQTPTERPSLTTSLEDRYKNQRVGGAYDAKEVKKQPIDFGFQNKTLQDPTGLAPETFSEKALNTSASSGHTTKKYKP